MFQREMMISPYCGDAVKSTSSFGKIDFTIPQIFDNDIRKKWSNVFSKDHTMSVFRNGIRKTENWIYSDWLYGDIDQDEIEIDYETICKIFENYTFILIPSRSYGKEKNGKVANRWHIYFPLKNRCSAIMHHREMLKQLCKNNPFLDKACADPCRFFFGNTDVNFLSINDVWFIHYGEFIDENYFDTIKLEIKNKPLIYGHTNPFDENSLIYKEIKSINDTMSFRKSPLINGHVNIDSNTQSDSFEILKKMEYAKEEISPDADTTNALKIPAPFKLPEPLEELPYYAKSKYEILMPALNECAVRGLFDGYAEWIQLGSALFHAGDYTVDDWIYLSHPEQDDLCRYKWASFENGTYTGRVAGEGTLVFFAKKVYPNLFASRQDRLRDLYRINE